MGMSKKRFHGESGSTLIIVVVAISFIGILGTLLLSLTTMNYQMKNINVNAKANFYSAEVGLDEIRSGLEEIVATEMQKAYEKLLVKYTAFSTEEEKDKFLSQEFIKGMTTALGGSDSNLKYNYVILKNFLTDQSVLQNDGASGTDQLVKMDLDCTLVLKDVKLNYVDSAGYSTSITTDIKIVSPTMTPALDSLNPAFTNYTLIADEMVELDASTGININGSIYAGKVDSMNPLSKYENIGGIVIKGGSKLTIAGNHKVITRSDIIVDNNCSLVVGSNGLPNDVWAQNIRTRDSSPASGTTKEAVINITGNTYTKDDLVLDSPYSKVTLAGRYFGFNYAETDSDDSKPLAEQSSAVMVNGKNSVLDMSKLQDLIIAGTSFISARQATNDVTAKDLVIGESITVKNNQVAYLVPNGYMDCGHNPMTEAELEQYNPGKKFAGKSIVSIPASDQIMSYLVPGTPYITIRPNSVYGTYVTYFYLNFKSQKDASNYFKEYYADAINKGKIDSYMDLYADTEDNGILLPTGLGRFNVAGNVLSYTKSGSELKYNDAVAYSNVLTFLHNEELHTMNKYKSLTETLLDYANYTPADKDSVFRSILSMSTPDKTLIQSHVEDQGAGTDRGFVSEAGYYIKDILALTKGSDNYYVKLIHNPGGPYAVTNLTPSGIIVATGDVTVQGNFKGTIIAGGNIYFSTVSNVEVSASEAIVSEIFSTNNKEINQYFKAYNGSKVVSGSNIKKADFSKQILYENWKKNED